MCYPAGFGRSASNGMRVIKICMKKMKKPVHDDSCHPKKKIAVPDKINIHTLEF